MIVFKVQGDFGKGLAASLQKQVRFATMKAINATAVAVAKAEGDEVQKVFDKPTPFIRKGFGIEYARRDNLTAIVFIRPKQAEILRPHIEGGKRGQKKFEQRLAGEAKASGFWVPGQGIKLNSYGNLTLAQLKAISDGLRKTGKYVEVFAGQPRNLPNAPFGIWGRLKRGKEKGKLKPLLIRIAQPGYRKRFDFFGVAQKTVGSVFAAEFDKALTLALATAR